MQDKKLNRILTRDQVRRVDQIAINELGFNGLVLMENAGRGVCDVMTRIGINGPVQIHCGRGNNAGDGFVIARRLHLLGYKVEVVLWAEPDLLQGDALVNFRLLTNSRQCLWRTPDKPSRFDTSNEGQFDWVLDGLLGTGAQGPLRPPFDSAVVQMNQIQAKKLAIDIPTGLDCDQGATGNLSLEGPSETIFRADHTGTFVATKPGLLLESSKFFVGQLHVIDIGVPFDWVQPLLQI